MRGCTYEWERRKAIGGEVVDRDSTGQEENRGIGNRERQKEKKGEKIEEREGRVETVEMVIYMYKSVESVLRVHYLPHSQHIRSFCP